MGSAHPTVTLQGEPGGAERKSAPGFFPGIAKRMLGRMPVELDDKALMLRYRDGDVTAFEMLYERHRGPLYRYLLRNVYDTGAAEDIFQEVWSRIVRNRASYRPLAKFTTYMYHIAHNCFIDHCRKTGRQPATVAIDDESAADTSAGTDPVRSAAVYDLVAQLKVALAELPAAQREAFLLHEESGLSLEEIGQAMGVGRETVKSRLRYALAKLRKSLPRDEIEFMTGTHDDR